MFNISSFFQKFAKIQKESLESKKVVIKAVKDACGLNIEGKNFTLDKGILRFNLSPILKNEIFMHKSKLLSKLNSGNFLVLVKDVR